MSALDGLPEDFRDLLVELADARAEFVLIGGWAMAVHGRTRATDDMDVLVRPSPENARRVFKALVAFGAPLALHRVTPDLFEVASHGYRFGVKPHLVEVLTTISGVDYDAASREVIDVEVEGRRVSVIGRDASDRVRLPARTGARSVIARNILVGELGCPSRSRIERRP